MRLSYASLILGSFVMSFAACGGGETPASTGSSSSGGVGQGGSAEQSAASAGEGGAGGGTGGAGGAGGAAFMPGPHAEPPLVPTAGGSVLTSLELVTITFAGDPHADLVEAFGDWAVTSPWLAAAEADYGVGKGTHLAKVRLPDAALAAPLPDDIKAFLVQKIADGTIPAPPSDKSNLLYAVYFPKETALALPGSTHCTDFSGYHTEGSAMGLRFAFAAIGDCPAYLKNFNEEQNILRTASHEIIEAATDPFISTDPAYVEEKSSSPWYYFAGEVADICPLTDVYVDGAFLGQRYWSNAAAKAGVDPCVPAPTDVVYYNTSVSPINTQLVPAGQSVVFNLQGWSAAEEPPWKLQAKAVLADFVPDLELDTMTMENGGQGTLTLTVPPNTPAGSVALVELFSYHTPAAYNTWPIAVRVK